METTKYVFLLDTENTRLQNVFRVPLSSIEQFVLVMRES